MTSSILETDVMQSINKRELGTSIWRFLGGQTSFCLMIFVSLLFCQKDLDAFASNWFCTMMLFYRVLNILALLSFKNTFRVLLGHLESSINPSVFGSGVFCH